MVEKKALMTASSMADSSVVERAPLREVPGVVKRVV